MTAAPTPDKDPFPKGRMEFDELEVELATALLQEHERRQMDHFTTLNENFKTLRMVFDRLGAGPEDEPLTNPAIYVTRLCIHYAMNGLIMRKLQDRILKASL